MAEQIVFLGLWAVSALEASDEEDGYPYRDQHGKDASVHRNPMCQGSHLHSPIEGSPFRGYDPVIQGDFTRRLRMLKKC